MKYLKERLTTEISIMSVMIPAIKSTIIRFWLWKFIHKNFHAKDYGEIHFKSWVYQIGGLVKYKFVYSSSLRKWHFFSKKTVMFYFHLQGWRALISQQLSINYIYIYIYRLYIYMYLIHIFIYKWNKIFSCDEYVLWLGLSNRLLLYTYAKHFLILSS